MGPPPSTFHPSNSKAPMISRRPSMRPQPRDEIWPQLVFPVITCFATVPSNRYLFGRGMDRAAIREENTYEHLKILRAPDALCVEADGGSEFLAAPSAG